MWRAPSIITFSQVYVLFTTVSKIWFFQKNELFRKVSTVAAMWLNLTWNCSLVSNSSFKTKQDKATWTWVWQPAKMPSFPSFKTKAKGGDKPPPAQLKKHQQLLPISAAYKKHGWVRSQLRANFPGGDSDRPCPRGGIRTALLSVQFCMPVQHHEVGERWRDTWQMYALEHSPDGLFRPNHYMGRL